MKRVILAAALALIVTSSVIGADDRSEPGQHRVTIIEGQWKDSQRDGRVVSWRCYLPKDLEQSCTTILYSPGGGGTRESNEMLGKHLVSHGFAALHLQHEGSDDRAVRRNPKALQAVNDPKASEPRFRDIAFVVGYIKAGKALGQLDGKLDPERIGISGHSYGGLTCQIIAGQSIEGYKQTLSLPDLRGAFILSPSPPRGSYGKAPKAFEKMHMPVFSVTGTADLPPDRAFQAKDRTTLFDSTTSVDQWLLVLDGASHFTTSGQLERPRFARLIPGMDEDPHLKENHACIRAAATAFWQSVLLNDETATAYLNTGDFERFVGKRGEFRYKPAKK